MTSLDLFGKNSVIRNAGGFTDGAYANSNFDVWEPLVTHVFRDEAIDQPWTSINSSFSRPTHAVDLTGDNVAELIIDQANMVFLGSAGAFPPVLDTPPVELIVSPAGPLNLAGPGDTRALTVYAVYDNGTSNDVTSLTLFDIDQPYDGTEAIRMSSNVVTAVNPTSSGQCRLHVDWTSVGTLFDVYVGNGPLLPISLRIVPGTPALTRIGEPVTFTAVATYEGGAEADVTPDVAFGTSAPGIVELQDHVGMAQANVSNSRLIMASCQNRIVLSAN